MLILVIYWIGFKVSWCKR